MHGRQVVDGVEQGLALAGRRGLDIEVDDIGRQALRGDLEGGAGARGVFKEQIETLLPRISGTFFTSRSEMPTNEEAVSRMWLTIDFGRPSIVSRCCSSPCLFSCGLSMVGI